MTRTRYFTASSVDGFIATDDHSLDWLLSRDAGDPAHPLGFEAFDAAVGAVALRASVQACSAVSATASAWIALIRS